MHPRATRPLTSMILATVTLMTGWAATHLRAQEVPFEAVVIEDAVPLRSGAGRSFYTVGQMGSGTRVTIQEVVFGWLKIAPPNGIYSYISRAYVDAYGDGKTGRINTSRAAVRAASVNGAGESYRRQIDLLKGDTVQIVGEEGSFYRIIPPEGAYVFLPPGAVQAVAEASSSDDSPARTIFERPVPDLSTPVTATDTGEPSANAAALGDDHTTPEASEETLISDETITAADATPSGETQAALGLGPLKPVSQALRDAEAKMIAAQTQPLEERPISELLDTYRALSQDQGLSLVDTRIIALRVSQLTRNAELADALREITQAKEQDSIVQYMDQVPAKQPAEYSARGQFLASAVYNGKTMPRLFRVAQPGGQRIVTYARLDPTVDVDPYLGRYVGVVGKAVYDPALKMELIEVQKLDVIDFSAAR